MTESDITRDWKHFIEKHSPGSTETWELKLVNCTKCRSFALDRVAEHQIVGLKASLDGLWLKIPDTAARNGFSSQKPFDVVWIKAYSASVVICWYTPRKSKIFTKIGINGFVELKKKWKKKSIRLEELLQSKCVETFYL